MRTSVRLPGAEAHQSLIADDMARCARNLLPSCSEITIHRPPISQRRISALVDRDLRARWENTPRDSAPVSQRRISALRADLIAIVLYSPTHQPPPFPSASSTRPPAQSHHDTLPPPRRSRSTLLPAKTPRRQRACLTIKTANDKNND